MSGTAKPKRSSECTPSSPGRRRTGCASGRICVMTVLVARGVADQWAALEISVTAMARAIMAAPQSYMRSGELRKERQRIGAVDGAALQARGKRPGGAGLERRRHHVGVGERPVGAEHDLFGPCDA